MSMQVRVEHLEYFEDLQKKLAKNGMNDDAEKMQEIIDMLDKERKRHNEATVKRITAKRKIDKQYARGKRNPETAAE